MPALRDKTPDPEETATAFRERFQRLLGRAPAGAFRTHGFAECVPGAWTSTGIAPAAGDRVTVLSSVTGGALSTRISMRVGAEGTVIQGTHRAHSIVAARSGTLEVMVDAPAAIVAIVWRESALRGLRYLASTGDVDGLVRDEILRLCNPSQAKAADCRPR